MKTARPGATISLFGFGQQSKQSESEITSRKPAPKSKPAPRGVPTISKWRENRDRSISGFISGSSAFDDGDAITTSPIASGEMVGGNVVQTGSGSRLVLHKFMAGVFIAKIIFGCAYFHYLFFLYFGVDIIWIQLQLHRVVLWAEAFLYLVVRKSHQQMIQQRKLIRPKNKLKMPELNVLPKLKRRKILQNRYGVGNFDF